MHYDVSLSIYVAYYYKNISAPHTVYVCDFVFTAVNCIRIFCVLYTKDIRPMWANWVNEMVRIYFCVCFVYGFNLIFNFPRAADKFNLTDSSDFNINFIVCAYVCVCVCYVRHAFVSVQFFIRIVRVVKNERMGCMNLLSFTNRI